MLVSALEQRDVASMLSISLFYYFFLLPSNHFTYSLAFFNASFCVLPRRTFLFLFLAYSCQSHEFRCHNSLCVDRNHLCDGVRHCTDGTDELAENCDKNNIISGKQHLHTFFNIFLYSYAVLKRQFGFSSYSNLIHKYQAFFSLTDDTKSIYKSRQFIDESRTNESELYVSRKHSFLLSPSKFIHVNMFVYMFFGVQNSVIVFRFFCKLIVDEVDQASDTDLYFAMRDGVLAVSDVRSNSGCTFITYSHFINFKTKSQYSEPIRAVRC